MCLVHPLFAYAQCAYTYIMYTYILHMISPVKSCGFSRLTRGYLPNISRPSQCQISPDLAQEWCEKNHAQNDVYKMCYPKYPTLQHYDLFNLFRYCLKASESLRPCRQASNFSSTSGSESLRNCLRRCCSGRPLLPHVVQSPARDMVPTSPRHVLGRWKPSTRDGKKNASHGLTGFMYIYVCVCVILLLYIYIRVSDDGTVTYCPQENYNRLSLGQWGILSYYGYYGRYIHGSFAFQDLFLAQLQIHLGQLFHGETGEPSSAGRFRSGGPILSSS